MAKARNSSLQVPRIVTHRKRLDVKLFLHITYVVGFDIMISNDYIFI